MTMHWTANTEPTKWSLRKMSSEVPGLCVSPRERARVRAEESFSHLGGLPLARGRWDQLGLVACGTGLAPLLQVASWPNGFLLVSRCHPNNSPIFGQTLEPFTMEAPNGLVCQGGESVAETLVSLVVKTSQRMPCL